MIKSMSSPDRRLALMQLSDSFFPSGSYTLSHGLESLISSGQVRSSTDFRQFLRILLHYKISSSDLVALVYAYRASQAENITEIQHADRYLFAQTVIQTARSAQQKSGLALLMVARTTWSDAQLETLHDLVQTDEIYCLHPIVFAVVSRAANLSQSDAVFAFLHSFVTGLSGAAIRLGAIGHIQAQVILKQISSDLESAAERVDRSNLDEICSCTPAIDIAQMQHQRLPFKLFAN